MKRIILLLLIVIVLCIPLNVVAQNVEIMPGSPECDIDVNGDGVTNIVDALFIAQYYVGIIELADPSIADINRDGKVDIIDAYELIKCFMYTPLM